MEKGSKVKLSKEGPALSQIVAGVMNWGVWGANLSTKDMATCIDACTDMGVTSFDHADIYGMYTTEAEFGAAMQSTRTSREDIEIITKCGICLPGSTVFPEFTVKAYDTTSAHIIRSVDHSLQNLKTDYIDVLLIHRPSPIMDMAQIATTFDKLRSAGKVRYFGVSNFTPSQMDLMMAFVPDIVTNQVEASVSANDVFLDGTLDHAQQHGYKAMAWSPLGGGSLFSDPKKTDLLLVLKNLGEKYEVDKDTLCYAFLLHHPSQILPITGSSKPARIEKAVRALDVNLSNEDWFVIWEACQGKSIP